MTNGDVIDNEGRWRTAAAPSRREALGRFARAAIWIGVAGCTRMIDNLPRRFGWDAAAAIPPGPYRAQVWQAPGQTTAPIFVALLAKPGVAARILEPYAVEDYGEVPPARIIDELRARYPELPPSGVEVESLAADGDAIGYVIRTRNIDITVDRFRSRGQFGVRLGGVGKYPLMPHGR